MKLALTICCGICFGIFAEVNGFKHVWLVLLGVCFAVASMNIRDKP